MAGRPAILLFLIAATAGLFFASFSTFDFVQHLDRQVHDLHCSFVPGLVEAESDSGGCQVTLMSPYSSLFRTAVWGGIPISLPAMAVFAFLLYRGIDLLGRGEGERKSAATFVLLASLIPVLASAVMGYIAFAELDAACKLCIGTYAASIVGFVAAIAARQSIVSAGAKPGVAAEGGGNAAFHGIVQLGVFVAIPCLVYVMLMPDYSSYVGTCGKLSKPEDPYGVMVAMDEGQGIPAVEVFDPLCPACRAFEERLVASGLDKQLRRTAVMFPLDDTCNWMVSTALHPGACTVSEAVLCAADNSAVSTKSVIDWAFLNQDQVRTAAKDDPTAAKSMVVGRFPELGKCLGSAEVQSKLNRSLRWAVANQIPVLTPQLYLDGEKLCDEDTDLGMDFALSRMIDRHKKGGGQ